MRATEPGAAAVPGAPAPADRRLPWRVAEILEVRRATARASTLVLRVPGWPGHRPGQHVDVRLTAEDGYQAQRSYSIASPPEDGHLALTVDRIDDGEVSPYLAGEARAGDRFELRGPVGGHFVWTAAEGGPLFLVSGGSGVVPLVAMLRHRAAAGSRVPARLLASWRSAGDIIHRDELARLAAAGDGLAVAHALTRTRPAGWTGYGRRIDAAMLGEFGFPPGERPRVFICGPTALVEAAAAALVALGHPPARVKTERFGPSGG
jgi:ferredoxin-NADP reductase